jgi:very-short-patch-repair endonuclease
MHGPRGDGLAPRSAVAVLSELAAATEGAFRGQEAVQRGVTRTQIAALRAQDVVRRVLPDTYVLSAVVASDRQRLRAALLWAGNDAAAAGRSAGTEYELPIPAAPRPEIVVARRRSPRHPSVMTSTSRDPASLMIRVHRGLRVTGPEATLVALGASLDDATFEIACEDARRRRLTSVPAVRAYLERFGRPGRPGVAATRALLSELDPVHAARSVLEVKTRRLLVAHGLTNFVRELPLVWNGRTYRYDFGFQRERTILETNGRRWHDDAADYEHDNEKWSVPALHGFRLVLATWDKVARRPGELVAELRAALAASARGRDPAA